MQEILDHADELATRFEDYAPSPDDEVAAVVCLLRELRSPQLKVSGRLGKQLGLNQ
jgi:hypothetical protein